MTAPLAVVILTHNEEVNLPFALESVCGWAEQVFVIDSFSTDRTVEIARLYGAEIVQNPFESYAQQRNWALNNLPITNDWILVLDADEYLSHELKEEIAQTLKQVTDDVSGFYIRRKFYFLGRWIKYGDAYSSLIRLMRRGRAKYITIGGFREKLIVQGRVLNLRGHIIHDDRKDISQWIAKQCKRAKTDAIERMGGLKSGRLQVLNHGTVEEHKRIWLRKRLLPRLPGPLRPFAQFVWEYIVRLGFLDGWPGFIHHFLLRFWYPLMVEAIYEELKSR